MQYILRLKQTKKKCHCCGKLATEIKKIGQLEYYLCERCNFDFDYAKKLIEINDDKEYLNIPII